MAEILNNNKDQKSKRRQVRVDLTPMVDLGFLLITFFVLTTSMTERKAMNTVIPNDKDSTKINICESCVLTLLPGENDVLYYYEGMEQHAIYKKTIYAASGLRQLIMNKKKAVTRLRHNDQFVLIIKPSEKSSFKNLVDIMDEAAICCVKRYYLEELNAADRKILQ